MSESRLSRVAVVLYEPQDPVNIAATVRAMKNMGVATLRLVRPCAYDPVRLEGIAHDTWDVIDRIEHRIETFALGRDGKYRRIEEENGKIPSTVLKGFYLRPEWLLAPRPPELLKVLREFGLR